MFTQAFPSGPYLTNSYIAACSQTKEAVIIDAAPDSTNTILAFFEKHQIKCVGILLTHSHWDHIADAAALKDHFQVPIYVHMLDVPNLESPGADELPLRMPITGVNPDVILEEGMIVKVGDLNFEVIHTPGHSQGSVCFYEPTQGVLFSGDTLFKGTIGNISFPKSAPNLMWDSLNKLAKLPPQTIVYPGHGRSTTIEKESWLPEAKKHFG